MKHNLTDFERPCAVCRTDAKNANGWLAAAKLAAARCHFLARFSSHFSLVCFIHPSLSRGRVESGWFVAVFCTNWNGWRMGGEGRCHSSVPELHSDAPLMRNENPRFDYEKLREKLLPLRFAGTPGTVRGGWLGGGRTVEKQICHSTDCLFYSVCLDRDKQ